MKTLINFATITLVIVFSLASNADFDKTKWSMSLDNVKKLYPSGHSFKNKDGTIMYWIEGVVEQYSSVIMFNFDQDRDLKYVCITVGDQKAKYGIFKDDISGEYPEIHGAEKSDMEPIFVKIYTALIGKYGKPNLGEKTFMPVWSSNKKRDHFVMMMIPEEKGSQKFEASIFYYRPEKTEQKVSL